MTTTRRSTAPLPMPTDFADASEMDKYRLVSNIGKGSFGVISKIQRIEDGKEFALKQLDYGKMNDKDQKQILAEVAILECLKHRNIVQLIQKIMDKKNECIYIVMEYCTHGDLGSLIRKAQRSNTPLHEDRIWSIFLQITLALHHCHWPSERKSVRGSAVDGRTQVLHRDLKPENVFLSGECVKLGDFGLSKDMAGHMFTQTYVGTPLYMPPEILAENRYDTKSDIWSLGCLVYEMCALHSPFHTARTQEELISMVKSGKLPPLPANISMSLRTAIKSMLSLNPVRRPSTKDLLDMEEMKLHRKLFTVQNQIAILSMRKEEIEQREARVRERFEALRTRERNFEVREREVNAREAALAEREASLAQREQNFGQEEAVLRENQRRIAMATDTIRDQWAMIRDEKEKLSEPSRSSEPAAQQPTRPPLEERKTLPVPLSANRHEAYNDTPSKIPFPLAYASPAPLDSKIASKISGLPSRRQSVASGGSLARRMTSKSMTNLASKARPDVPEEDFPRLAGCSTPSRQRGISSHRSPNRHVNGRASVGSPGELERAFQDFDVTMHTATSFSSPVSTLGTPFVPRPRQEDEDAPGLPPTLIPAPTYIYRPEATPAKWSPEDPDLPSPFLRRRDSSSSSSGSAAGSAPTSAPTAAPDFHIGVGPDSRSRSAQETRPPLSAINAQPSALPAQPQRKLPRSKSGNLSLHARVLQHNASKTEGMGPPVRTRVGRDPARC